ncbi:MAG: TonB-dependent receptor plug domain-containing protein [Bacteroidota bacterium]
MDDTIWFKVYLLDALSHHPKSTSEIVYIDLINPLNETIASRIIKTANGFGEGDFILPFDIAKGIYIIRAYTRAMLDSETTNFFEKSLYLDSPYYILENKDITFTNRQKIDLQFLPEGGSIVNGFINRIAFKALNENGLGIDINGTIVDQYNNKVLEFETSKFGMGVLQLVPEESKEYRAIVSYNGVETSYDFPKTLNTGVIIKLIEYQDHFRVNMLSSLKDGSNNFSFTIRQRKGLVCEGKIKGNKSKGIIKVPKNVLEPGILQFTLYDENGHPICERLAFNEMTEDEIQVIIEPSKSFNNKRAKVTLNIKKQNSDSEEDIVNGSISVTKAFNGNRPKENVFNIKTYLLLDSELRGNIENPNYYFYSDDPHRRKNLDILMMTQGWRRFLDQPTNQESAHNESGITIKGKVFNEKRKKSPIIYVTLAYRNKNEVGYDETVTDIHGNFSFKDLNFSDTTSVLIKTKNSNLLIELDSLISSTKKSSNSSSQISSNLNTTENQGNNPNLELIKTEHPPLTDKDVVRLKEVEVQAKKKEKEDRLTKKRILYSNPSNSVDFKGIPQNYSINPLEALVGRVPGFSLNGTNVNLRSPSSLTPSNNRVLFLLDGTPVFDVETILEIPFGEVDFIDVLKGPKAAIYGSRASGGVIAVYTKDGTKRTDLNKGKIGKSIDFTHPGFYVSREFYVPKYDSPDSKLPMEDIRKSTIFWEPKLILNDNNSVVSFYSSDMVGLYEVILEGLSSKGLPVFSTATIEIE